MISCKALKEQSLFVSAMGEILPCCYIADGAKISNKLQELTIDPTYKTLVESWSTPFPYHACRIFCKETPKTIDKE
jgi:hypothetical protein